MTKTKKEEPFLYALKRIKDFGFNVNESLYINEPEKMVKVEFQHRLGFSLEQNMVELNLRAFYHYPDAPLDEVLAEIQVQNLFEIPNISRFLDANNIVVLPEELIITIVSLSISHTRALFTKSLAGTVLQDVLLPIVDARAMSEFFFPYMFGGDTANIKAIRTMGNVPTSSLK